MKKIIYIDMDDVLCDFKGAYQEALLKNPDIKYPQSQYGFWQKLKPIDNAVETVTYLKKHFDIYILSAPSIYNPLSYTEKRVWVEEYLGFDMIDKLILSRHKGLNKGDYLIDDILEGNGQENFEGELINFGSTEFLDWETIKKFFVSLEKN